MKTYVGSKVIKATPMNRADYNALRGWELPSDEDGQDEGFLVEYADGGAPNVAGYDGYISWSPKAVFNNAYHDDTHLTFSDALMLMKRGYKVARAGWNGKGMFIYRVPANNYAPTTEAAKSTFGDSVPYGAYYAMKTADNNVVPWLCSQTDMEAEDWCVVD